MTRMALSLPKTEIFTYYLNPQKVGVISDYITLPNYSLECYLTKQQKLNAPW